MIQETRQVKRKQTLSDVFIYKKFLFDFYPLIW